MVGWNHQTPTLFVEVVSWKPAMSDAEDRQIEQWKVKRLVKMLDAARGNLEQSIVLQPRSLHPGRITWNL